LQAQREVVVPNALQVARDEEGMFPRGLPCRRRAIAAWLLRIVPDGAAGRSAATGREIALVRTLRIRRASAGLRACGWLGAHAAFLVVAPPRSEGGADAD